jgi:hypothetical protein
MFFLFTLLFLLSLFCRFASLYVLSRIVVLVVILWAQRYITLPPTFEIASFWIATACCWILRRKEISLLLWLLGSTINRRQVTHLRLKKFLVNSST